MKLIVMICRHMLTAEKNKLTADHFIGCFQNAMINRIYMPFAQIFLHDYHAIERKTYFIEFNSEWLKKVEVAK